MAEGYYSNIRRDLLAMVPDGAQRILSLGCGEGRTEAELVRSGRSVLGVELFPAAAAAARKNGLEVLEGDLESIAPAVGERNFDCLIFGDILEHLRAPEKVLGELASKLVDGGTVIVSVPNFRCWGVFRQLFLRGEVVYEDAGVLDRTHLRLTTRKMVERWFHDAGIVPDGVVWNISRRRAKLAAAMSLGLLREFLASQVVVRGVKRHGRHLTP